MRKTFHLLDVFGRYILTANNGMHATRGWLESGRRLRCKNRPWSSGVDIRWIDTDMSMLKWMMYSIVILSYLILLPRAGWEESATVGRLAPLSDSCWCDITPQKPYDCSPFHFSLTSPPKCCTIARTCISFLFHLLYLRNACTIPFRSFFSYSPYPIHPRIVVLPTFSGGRTRNQTLLTQFHHSERAGFGDLSRL